MYHTHKRNTEGSELIKEDVGRKIMLILVSFKEIHDEF